MNQDDPRGRYFVVVCQKRNGAFISSPFLWRSVDAKLKRIGRGLFYAFSASACSYFYINDNIALVSHRTIVAIIRRRVREFRSLQDQYTLSAFYFLKSSNARQGLRIPRNSLPDCCFTLRIFHCAQSAEGKGFEPLKAFTLLTFQASALGHYANPPTSERYDTAISV